MGYHTKFQGHISIEPALDDDDYEWLSELHETRHEDKNFPGYYCQWQSNRKGTQLSWDGEEKFYDSVEWMTYIVNHLKDKYTFNGKILAQGEEMNDRWVLTITDNIISVKDVSSYE